MTPVAATLGIGILTLARRMLGHKLEMGVAGTTLFLLAGNSMAAIAMSRKKEINKRNRHIEVRAMLTQHCTRTPGVSLQKVLGERNGSGILTKVDNLSKEHMVYLGIVNTVAEL